MGDDPDKALISSNLFWMVPFVAVCFLFFVAVMFSIIQCRPLPCTWFGL